MTIREYYDTLPSEARERAYYNHENGVKNEPFWRSLEEDVSCLYLAITCFGWRETKEGHKYWSDISAGKFPEENYYSIF